jgi:hypothetical protein
VLAVLTLCAVSTSVLFKMMLTCILLSQFCKQNISVSIIIILRFYSNFSNRLNTFQYFERYKFLGVLNSLHAAGFGSLSV